MFVCGAVVGCGRMSQDAGTGEQEQWRQLNVPAARIGLAAAVASRSGRLCGLWRSERRQEGVRRSRDGGGPAGAAEVPERPAIGPPPVGWFL